MSDRIYAGTDVRRAFGQTDSMSAHREVLRFWLSRADLITSDSDEWRIDSVRIDGDGISVQISKDLS